MGTYVYLCLIHIFVRQKQIQHCKAPIKKKKLKVKKNSPQLGRITAALHNRIPLDVMF